MISKNGEKVLNFLLRNCSYPGYNINQIAKEVDISIGSSFKILNQLKKSRILRNTILGNASFYMVDKEEESMKLCELMLIRQKKALSGYPAIYADSLVKINSEVIVLFGSILHKKGFKDVDVMFMTRNVDEIMKGCENISKIRTKSVHPLLLTKQDLLRELIAGKPVIKSIAKEGVVLKGEDIFVDVMLDAAMVPRKREQIKENSARHIQSKSPSGKSKT